MPETSEGATPGAKIDINLQSIPDVIIRDLVELVNGTNAEIPITLMISGILISGWLVSSKLYLEYLIPEIALACKDDEIVNVIQSRCKAALEKHDTPPKSEENPPPPSTYIHLKNAQYFLPGQKPIPKTGGIWWRGSISEVDGFSLGMLYKLTERSMPRLKDRSW